MVTEPHDWSVPAPLRTLLWWPPLAFFLVLLEPSAAAGTIAATGAALAVLGAVGAAAGQLIARRRTRSAGPVGPPSLTVATADAAMPMAAEQRAA